MADTNDQEPISPDKDSKYNKYPLRPSFVQRAKERFNPDLSAELDAVRSRRLRAIGEQDSSQF